MTNYRKLFQVITIWIILSASLLMSSCSNSENGNDPSSWGYDCTVTYDTLGGKINSREVRVTYYMKNSYLFEPSGTTNMLIEPTKDGYILSGWYTAKEDIKDDSNNIIDYDFKPEDRWDFDEDRVQEDMTLYARWIPQGKVDYVDASTDEIMFTKNITSDSPIQPLSGATEKLIEKTGSVLSGYYSDKACTVPYNFTEYTYVVPTPSKADIYAQLAEEFPKYFKRVDYVEPEKSEEEEEEVITEDTSDLFINKLGYEITTADESIRKKIRKRKDEIYENAIQEYVANTSEKLIYLNYTDGSYASISSPEDLKVGNKYSFSGLNKAGNPIDGYTLMNDIDFSGITLELGGSFSGEIIGNGFSLKNITLKVNSKKIDKDKSKSVGIFQTLDGAYIEGLNIEDMTISLNVNSGIPVSLGTLAVEAKNTELKNVTLKNVIIDTGKGDDGTAEYKVGDLFGIGENNKFENVTGSNININASETAKINKVIE